MHVDDPLAKLVRAGFRHVQFEIIYPYLDRNGRIGRLLIALLLEQIQGWQCASVVHDEH
ncbi:Fic family protein [Mesorhizobium sp. M0976]|uniref:Fic family protein n=1 Tax=Mesorhizobium sp. M0976 TaxID=2957038 RepID=UPI003336665C